MQKFWSILFMLMIYCTPFVIVAIPVMLIMEACRKKKPIKKEVTCNKDEHIPEIKNHYGVDL